MSEMQYLGDNACPTVTKHDVTACVPVCIRPFAEPGPVVVECAGNPEIRSDCGRGDCEECGCCEFTVSQKMRINIPIAFGAGVQVGEVHVSCGETQGTIDPDCPCGAEQAPETDDFE